MHSSPFCAVIIILLSANPMCVMEQELIGFMVKHWKENGRFPGNVIYNYSS